MLWTQVYDPFSNITLSAMVAMLPLAILFYMLAVKRAKGHVAAACGLAGAFAATVAVWGMPAGLAVNATLYGVAMGLFPIIWIVLTAVWLYNMTVESGEFEIIKSSLARLTDDRRLQALFIAFAFGAFLEGTAGFGTPVAITAAMLMGLGFSPVYAGGICLIANTAPVAFGALGIPVIVASQVSGLDTLTLSQYVGRQLPVFSLIVPLWMTVVMCGFKRTMEVMPAIVVASVCFSGTQFIFADWHGPTLPDVMAAIVTIVGLLVLLRFWKPARTWHFADEKPEAATGETRHSTGEVLRAWAPYAILAVFVFFWGLGSVKTFLNNIFIMSFEWPGLHAAIAKTAPIVKADAPYAAKFTFNLISAGGTAILFAGLLSVPVMPGYGYGRAFGCLARTCYQLRFPILTIVMILGLAQLMNYSGMSSTLGIAFTHTGALFPFFAPIMGWLGVFLTGSNTSSNALFGSMQHATASAVGVDPYLTVAANATGGVTGKMISPQSISVATASTHTVGQEGALFRFALKHSIAMTLVICVLVTLQAYVIPWMLPAR